jgi:hypothetical protein
MIFFNAVDIRMDQPCGLEVAEALSTIVEMDRGSRLMTFNYTCKKTQYAIECVATVAGE